MSRTLRLPRQSNLNHTFPLKYGNLYQIWFPIWANTLSFKNCGVFLHHGLAGGELGQDVVWILVVVRRCRESCVELPPDGDVVRLGGLVPLRLLRDQGELVAKHLPRKDLECRRDQSGKKLRFNHILNYICFYKFCLKSLFEDAIKSRKLQKLDSNPVPWFL